MVILQQNGFSVLCRLLCICEHFVSKNNEAAKKHFWSQKIHLTELKKRCTIYKYKYSHPRALCAGRLHFPGGLT